MFAAENGKFHMVQLLLEFRPQVNIKDSVSYHIEYLKHCYSTHLIYYVQSNKTAFDLATSPEIRHCLKVAPVRQ